MRLINAAAVAVLMLTAVPSIVGQERSQSDPSAVGAVTRRFIPREPYNWREAAIHALDTTIWYPVRTDAAMTDHYIGPTATPLFTLGRWADDAQALPGRFPFIAVSHGTGGSAQMMAWLARDLASRGYIVAAVNHPGNNALEDYTAEGFLLWWERARDLSTVIDSMLSDRQFGSVIDRARIGAAGFSLGGYTVLALAGARTDPALLQKFCASPAAQGCDDPTEFPNLFKRWAELQAGNAGFQARAAEAGRSYRDPRVRASFAIAPAVGPALVPESLSQVAIPVEILVGENDEIVPLGPNARPLARLIPGARLTQLPGGHYTFLATCTDAGKRAQPLLCTDPANVDRTEVHRRTSEMAARFFSRTLN